MKALLYLVLSNTYLILGNQSHDFNAVVFYLFAAVMGIAALICLFILK